MKLQKPPVIVTVLNERWRIIEAPENWKRQWLLQRRKGSYRLGGGAWGTSAYCVTRQALARNISERCGECDPIALAVVDALPEKASERNG